MTGDGLDLLKPFWPGLEAALDDPDVSEIMINGPGNVWLEGHGRLRPIEAPALDAAALAPFIRVSRRRVNSVAAPVVMIPRSRGRGWGSDGTATTAERLPLDPRDSKFRRHGVQLTSAAGLVEELYGPCWGQLVEQVGAAFYFPPHSRHYLRTFAKPT